MRIRTIRACVAALAIAGLAPVATAGATWSIVAVDPATQEVGVAGASCITGAELLARLVPGRGAVAAQAIPNLRAQAALGAALARGESATSALGPVTRSGFDSLVGVPTIRLRQYGVVSLASVETPASFTGTWTVGWAGSRQAPGVSVQGNMLRGPEVVEQALAAFQAERPGCTRRLSDRLMDALAAGARAGGDRRCSPELSALSAFLEVARPEDPSDAPSLRLVRNAPGALVRSPWSDFRRSLMIAVEKGTAAQNPVFLLRKDYEAARPKAACP